MNKTRILMPTIVLAPVLLIVAVVAAPRLMKRQASAGEDLRQNITWGGVTFVGALIETRGEVGQSALQGVVAAGGGLTEAGDEVAAFLLGLDISLITNIVEEATGGSAAEEPTAGSACD